MSKLIYSDSLQKFQSLFPEWNVITDPSYKAIVFTKDNYIVTHGHVFKTDSGGETGNANFAPILHADITSKYGAGDTTNYGHVKLTDTVNFPSSYGGTTPVETNGVSSGFAATPMAVRAAYNTAYAHAKAYADSLLSANDAMIFKGTIGTGGTVTALPTNNYFSGWTYRVITAGNYAGQVCEIGDLIISIKNGPALGSTVINADWTVSQANIDGAVTSANNFGGSDRVILSGGANKTIKDLTAGSTNQVLMQGASAPVWTTLSNLTYGLAGNTITYNATAAKSLLLAAGGSTTISFNNATGTFTISSSAFDHKIFIGASGATEHAVTANGNLWLNLIKNGTTLQNAINIVGSGAITVVSDATGKIIIDSTNSWRAVNALLGAAIGTGVASTTTPTTISTNTLEFTDDFIRTDASTTSKLSLAWTEIDSNGVVKYYV